MQNSKEQRPNLPLIGVVLLMAAASGYYFYGKPFESSRPRGGVIETSSTLGPQSVPARLWEDPFTAVSKHQSWEQQPDLKGQIGMFQMIHRPPDHSLTHLKDQIGENVKEHNKVTIMPVMVFGGPYAENVEDRRRRRYAVLSALTVSGYRAIDPEHIDYFQILWLPASNANKHAKEDTGQCTLNQSPSTSPPSKGYLVIPYEWLIPSDKRLRPGDSIPERHGAILLLWLDDNLFADCPLSRLERLIESLIEKPQVKNLSFKVIGPAGSTTLHEMVQEARERQGRAFMRLKSSEIEIYSATATASNTLLLTENETKTPPQKCPPVGDKSTGEMDEAEKAIEKAFCTLGIKFRRTIPTDYELACSLKEELVRRGVEPGNPNRPIALIREWDTFYGRSLPATFSTVFEERRNRSGSTG